MDPGTRGPASGAPHTPRKIKPHVHVQFFFCKRHVQVKIVMFESLNPRFASPRCSLSVQTQRASLSSSHSVGSRASIFSSGLWVQFSQCDSHTTGSVLTVQALTPLYLAEACGEHVCLQLWLPRRIKVSLREPRERLTRHSASPT